MPTCDVLVIGSANLDLVFRSATLPLPGETLLGESFATHAGGKGANQAVAAGRLGGRVAMAGCLGNDANGETLAKSLLTAGVQVSSIARLDHTATGTAGIFVADDGSNVIIVAPGANGHVTAGQVESAIGDWDPAIVIAQLEIPLDAVMAASAHPRFILNPAPGRPLPDALLARCFLLTPNESELDILTGSQLDADTRVKACESLIKKGAQNVVVTLGKQGCLWVTASHSQPFPAPEVTAIDTTAAGDAFNGAMAFFLSQNLGIAASIEQAIQVASLSVTRSGAQESMPTLEEVRAFAGSGAPSRPQTPH